MRFHGWIGLGVILGAETALFSGHTLVARWATARWTYTVPYLGGVKLFEMPVLGYLGFPPFALECYAMYHALRGVLVAGTRTATPLI